MFGDISPKLPGAQNALRGTSVTSVDGQTGAVNLTSDFDAAGTAAGLLGSLTSGAVWIPVSGAPSSGVGINGDYAWDPVAQVAYGPKASGSWPAGTALSLPTFSGAPLASGEATVLRSTTFDSVNLLTSGTLQLTYFTAVKSESSVAVTIFSSTETATATDLTYAAVGLYSVNPSSSYALTLQASVSLTGSPLSSFCDAQYTAYKLDFGTPYTRTAGNLYAIGVLLTGTSMPSLLSTGGNGVVNSIPPRAAALYAVPGGSPLPSSLSDSSLSTTYINFFATVTPS
jgi:hypothetical protein